MDECLSYNVNLRGDLFTRIRFDAPNLVSVSLLLLFNLFVEGFVVFVSSIDSHPDSSDALLQTDEAVFVIYKAPVEENLILARFRGIRCLLGSPVI